MKKGKLVFIFTVLIAISMLSSCAKEQELPSELLTENVAAKVLDVNNFRKTLLVSGLDDESLLGMQCYVTGYEDGFSVQKLTENEYDDASFRTIVEGDVITLTIVGDVAAGFPSQAVALEYTINPVRTNPALNPMTLWPFNAEKLDDTTDIESLLNTLSYPEGALIEEIGFTEGETSSLTVTFDAEASYLDTADLTPYDQNAIILYGLIKDLEEIVYIFGEQEIPYSKSWAESIVSASLINELENAEDLGALLTIVYDISSTYEDYHTAVVYDVKTGDSTGVELYSSNERDPVNTLRDLLIYEGDPIAESEEDMPVDVPEYMFINIAILDLSTTIIEQYYIYEKDGMKLMEIPNEGIWEINEESHATLMSLKSNNTSDE